MDRRDRKIDISGMVAFIILILLLFLTNLLTSCVDLPEPYKPTIYTYTIEKDCESCRIGYWFHPDTVKILNEKVAYRQAIGEAISGDTLEIRVINIASGVNNNILFPVNGLLTIQSDTTYTEIDLGGANYRQLQYIFK